MILFAPRAEIKFRSTASDAKERLINCIHILYQGRYWLREQLVTAEWAMIASLGNKDGTISGEIPRHYRAQTNPASAGSERAFVERVYEAGLRTQNYDKGFDKFVRKFERNEAMSATVALLEGHREDHGWAVYCTQGPRRCLLLNTEDGLSADETLWTALAAWASFKPRETSPRKYPGKLFYPTEASHIFEKYWDYLTRMDEHPDFASETPICQERMVQFSRALSKLRTSNWTPLSTAEAHDKHVQVAQEAALSRLRPIPDGPDQCALCRSSTVTVGPLSLGSSMVGAESVPGPGSTGTCATSGRPLQT
jgi:hypothetical protein